MDAVQLASGDVQLPGVGRASAQAHGVEAATEILHGVVNADVHSGPELDSLFFQEADAFVHQGLVQLEIRYPEGQ